MTIYLKNGYHRLRMLKEGKEIFVDPKKCAKTGEILEGHLPLVSFSLPAEVLFMEGSGTAEEVHYHLKFGFDSEEYIYIEGFIEATLPLQCQRCLKSMTYPIHSDFQLSPIKNEAASAALPSHYEAVLMDQEQLSILRLVEDELILNLPLAPSHTAGSTECRS